MKKKIINNQNATDVVLNSGKYMPQAVYMNKYGKEMSDEELGAVVRKNHDDYLRSIKENTPHWQEEGEAFRKARQALN